MSFLNLDGGSGSASIVERLGQERKRRTAKSVGFDAVDVDEAILQAAVLLFRDRQQQHHDQGNRAFAIDSGRNSSSSPTANTPKTSNVKLEKLCINCCPANPFLEYLIEAAMGMDLFEEFELTGNMDEEELAAEREAEREAEYVAHRQLPEQQEAANQNENVGADADAGEPPPQAGREPTGHENHGDGDGDETGDVPPSSRIFAIDALGFRMRFSRRLRKLELINLPLTRDHAESLMYGIETNDTTGTGCRLDTLVMDGVRFVHDDDEEGEDENDDPIEEEAFGQEDETGQAAEEAIDGEEADALPTSPGDGTVVVKELCEGFPINSTLKTIGLQRCRLTDYQVALIFDSLAHHPTLKTLNLAENSCRKLGFEALDRILVSPQWMPKSDTEKMDTDVQHYCKIESLDLSYQFTSEETYATGEHIQLDILTRNCTTTDADMRIYPNLLKLDLQGNQIYDSDMADLAFLIQHRFPRLEELDLRFNEITAEGLEAFAKHSDPSNDCYRSSISFPIPSSRLRTIRLTNNPLVMTDQTSNSILKLLKIYPELQLIQSNLPWEDQTSVAQNIQHLLDINRAGRVLLLADNNGTIDGTIRRLSETGPTLAKSSAEKRRRSQLRQQERRPFPVAAWPQVLARLTRQARYPHYIPLKNCLNGMYYLIRHGPIIMEQMAARATRKTTPKKKKKKKTMNLGRKDNLNDRKRQRGDPALGGYATIEEFLRCELGDDA